MMISTSLSVCVMLEIPALYLNTILMAHFKVHMCRAKVSSRSCVFYNNVDGMRLTLVTYQ